MPVAEIAVGPSVGKVFADPRVGVAFELPVAGPLGVAVGSVAVPPAVGAVVPDGPTIPSVTPEVVSVGEVSGSFVPDAFVPVAVAPAASVPAAVPETEVPGWLTPEIPLTPLALAEPLAGAPVTEGVAPETDPDPEGAGAVNGITTVPEVVDPVTLGELTGTTPEGVTDTGAGVMLGTVTLMLTGTGIPG